MDRYRLGGVVVAMKPDEYIDHAKTTFGPLGPRFIGVAWALIFFLALVQQSPNESEWTNAFLMVVGILIASFS